MGSHRRDPIEIRGVIRQRYLNSHFSEFTQSRLTVYKINSVELKKKKHFPCSPKHYSRINYPFVKKKIWKAIYIYILYLCFKICKRHVMRGFLAQVKFDSELTVKVSNMNTIWTVIFKNIWGLKVWLTSDLFSTFFENELKAFWVSTFSW